MWRNILATGGSGRLGTELKRHLKAQYPTHKELDITNIKKDYSCDIVLHMAAYTDVDGAQVEKFKCFDTNVMGTFNMLSHYPDKPFVFLSTEHANAEGAYCQSKLACEMMVKNLAKNYLIIRTLFKPTPWPWEYAFADQITQGDYIDVIAPMIAEKINNWGGKSESILVGTGRKTMLELAQRTKPDVIPNSVEDMPLRRAKDYI